MLRALAEQPVDQAAYGDPATAADFTHALRALYPEAVIVPTDEGSLVVSLTHDDPALRTLAFAFGWAIDGSDSRGIRLVRISP